RVAAGAIARKVLASLYANVSVRGALIQIGSKAIDRAKWDWAGVEENTFFCPDATAVGPWTEYLEGMRKKGSSVGAVIEVVAEGLAAGLGWALLVEVGGDIAAAE